MKNKKFQSLIRSSKRYFKKSGNIFYDPVKRVSIYHEFDDETKQFWWGDFSTYCGSQRLMIWAIHLRMSYFDECESIASELHRFPENVPSFKTVPVKKPIGKSRKRIIYYRSVEEEERQQVISDYFQELEKLKQEVMRTGDVIIRPNYKTEQHHWCRSIDIVTNEELNTKEQVYDFITRCRLLAGNKEKFENLFDTSVIYDRNEWMRENEETKDFVA